MLNCTFQGKCITTVFMKQNLLSLNVNAVRGVKKYSRKICVGEKYKSLQKTASVVNKSNNVTGQHTVQKTDGAVPAPRQSFISRDSSILWK